MSPWTALGRLNWRELTAYAGSVLGDDLRC